MISIVSNFTPNVNREIKKTLTDNNTLPIDQPQIVKNYFTFGDFSHQSYKIYYSFIDLCDRDVDLFILSIIQKHSDYGNGFCYLSTSSYGKYLADISKSTASLSLNRLVKNGLIEKVSNNYKSNSYKLTDLSLSIMKNSKYGYIPNELMSLSLNNLPLSKRIFFSYLVSKYDNELDMVKFQRDLPQLEINFTESNLYASLAELKDLNLIEQIYSKDGYVRIKFPRNDLFENRNHHNNKYIKFKNCDDSNVERALYDSENRHYNTYNENYIGKVYKCKPNIIYKINKSSKSIFVGYLGNQTQKSYIVDTKISYELRKHDINFIRKAYGKFIPEQLIRDEIEKLRLIINKSGEEFVEQKMFIYRASIWLKKTYKKTVSSYIKDYKNKIKSGKIYNDLANFISNNKFVFSIFTDPFVSKVDKLAAQIIDSVNKNISYSLENSDLHKKYMPSLRGFKDLLNNIKSFDLKNNGYGKEWLELKFAEKYYIDNSVINALSKSIEIDIIAKHDYVKQEESFIKNIKERFLSTLGYIPDNIKERYEIGDCEIDENYLPESVKLFAKKLQIIFNKNKGVFL